jgi:hypothetical protein
MDRYNKFKELYHCDTNTSISTKYLLRNFAETYMSALGTAALICGGILSAPYLAINISKNFTYTEIDRYGNILQQFTDNINDGKYIDVYHTASDGIIVDSCL